jgi:hypothetical protein
MKYSILSRTALASAMALALVSIPAAGAPVSEQDSDLGAAGHIHAVPQAGNYVLRYRDGGIACDDPTPEELGFVLTEVPESDLTIISPARKDANGLTIVLRGTTQLNSFPAAQQGFVAAAARWQALIKSPITVIMDVDFGPTRFGEPYPDGVLGSTSSQIVGGSNNYNAIRSALVSKASPAEAATIAALPTGSVPTDIGNAPTVYTAATVFRALGLLAAVANPTTETNLGAPPKIGFNSDVPWDFDPSNGIDNDKIDFDATAVHEIGHALGFISMTGYRELDSSFPIAVSTWDLFRFRPGVASGTFGSGQRVLSSGGSQVFFGGASALGLSTGRPDGSGGDQQQASHWKSRYDNPGGYIGVMDPTGALGDRDVITQADVVALDRMGYSLGAPGVPAISQLNANLDGDSLFVTGTAVDSDKNLATGRVTIQDPAGTTIATSNPFQVLSNNQTSVEFSLRFNSMRAIGGAVKLRMTVTDAAGNTSAEAEADFSGGDPGAAAIGTAKYNKAKKTLQVKGTGFAAGVQVEVNGVILTGFNVKVNATGTAVKVKGASTALGLRSGLNSIRVRSGGLRSNIAVLSF